MIVSSGVPTARIAYIGGDNTWNSFSVASFSPIADGWLLWVSEFEIISSYRRYDSIHFCGRHCDTCNHEDSDSIRNDVLDDNIIDIIRNYKRNDNIRNPTNSDIISINECPASVSHDIAPQGWFTVDQAILPGTTPLHEQGTCLRHMKKGIITISFEHC